MLTDYEREVATTLVEALCEYGLTDHLAQYGERGTENWFDDCMLNTFGFSAAGGASKVCIWHGDLCGWVIKVGYTEKVGCDYATLEYENYLRAVEDGFDAYFPTTIYLGEFGGRDFYLQEYADCDENRVSSDWFKRVKDQHNEDGEEYDPDHLWDELDCLDDYEKAFLSFRDSAFCIFLWDNGIGDLHEGNFGYIGDRLVIVDMAGWRG